MRHRTSFGLAPSCELPTAAITWLYPSNLTVPYREINRILAAFYNRQPGIGPGEYPYFYPVQHEVDCHQIALIIADVLRVDDQGETQGVELTDDDKRNLFASSLMEPRTPGSPPRTFWVPEQGLAGVEWDMPHGQVLPVDCINAVFQALYEMDIQPFLYPVFNRNHPSGTIPQIGVLLSQKRPEIGSADYMAKTALDDFAHLMSTVPSTVPWGQKEWDCA